MAVGGHSCECVRERQGGTGRGRPPSRRVYLKQKGYGRRAKKEVAGPQDCGPATSRDGSVGAGGGGGGALVLHVHRALGLEDLMDAGGVDGVGVDADQDAAGVQVGLILPRPVLGDAGADQAADDAAGQAARARPGQRGGQRAGDQRRGEAAGRGDGGDAAGGGQGGDDGAQRPADAGADPGALGGLGAGVGRRTRARASASFIITLMSFCP